MDPNPVDAPGARQLADTYNRELRQELGLAPTSRREAPTATPIAGLDLRF
ncbi:MAG: hypothetical protein HY901_05360 [Deltaproteobacteria bacterium]|nr:hypothetical protein [Deltaproteobacteria bacterium]